MKRSHQHKYERMQWPNGGIFYKCMIPGCPHYLPNANLVIMRESVCWGGCNRLVTITKEDVQKEVKHPMCEFCKAERLTNREKMANI